MKNIASLFSLRVKNTLYNRSVDIGVSDFSFAQGKIEKRLNEGVLCHYSPTNTSFVPRLAKFKKVSPRHVRHVSETHVRHMVRKKNHRFSQQNPSDALFCHVCCSILMLC